MIEITMSIFCSPDTPFANVYGELDVPCAPVVGDLLSYAMLTDRPLPERFNGMPLRVIGRMFRAKGPGEIVLTIELEPIVAVNEADAESIAIYFERGFAFKVFR